MISFVKRVWRSFLGLPRIISIGGVVVVVIVLVVGFQVLSRSGAAPAASVVSNTSHVKVSSVGTLSSPTGPLPVTGKVTSLSQAAILAQASGEVVTLNRSLGSRVGAGDIIATFENSSQRAAVTQAQGGYDAAQAALTKVMGNNATNSGITSTQAATGAENAKIAAAAALQSAYAALDDAVHTKADVLFSNPRTDSPTLVLTLPDSQLQSTLQNQRVQLESALSEVQSLVNKPGDVDANIATALADAQIVQTFLNNLVKALNQALPSQSTSAATIAASQAAIGGARSSVSGAISGLNGAKSAYDAAVSGAQTAANTATTGSQSDIASAQANVKQALGGLHAAEANLEKTIIRSPISGTIVSLPITQGGFVSAFAPVASISNPGALEIKTNVTSDDAKTIAVGGKALINGNVSGIITSVAPALDPTTGKIEVKIGITGSQSSLTDGDTVTVSLDRVTTTAQTKPSANTNILIPIVAAKITPDGPVVFTVSSSTLVASPITLGTILGDQVVVVKGLTPSMEIVTDARGLTNGQVVVVDSN